MTDKTAGSAAPDALIERNGESVLVHAEETFQVSVQLTDTHIIVGMYTQPMAYAGGIHFASYHNLPIKIIGAEGEAAS